MMSRRTRPRQIDFLPEAIYFKPRGVPLSSLDEVKLTIDEWEATRLVDLKKLPQTKAALKMKISQSTLQRILKKAHYKIAQALTQGKAIKIEGGEIMMPRFGRGGGQAQGRAGGRGRLGGPFAAGPGGVCVCTNPECKKEISHQAGVPCYQIKCPECGSPMIRKR